MRGWGKRSCKFHEGCLKIGTETVQDVFGY